MISKNAFITAILIFISSLVSNGDNSTKTNIILITLDTVRADHLGCYGYKDIKTPTLDWLASKGILFEDAITSAPITLPAHASLLTGLYPYHNNVRDNADYRLYDNATTLATLMKKNGYRTAAFISSIALSSMYNLDQGFDEYNEKFDFHESEWGGYNERRADSVTKSALDWLNANKNYPYFIWIHYFDAHTAYEPPEPWLSQYRTHRYDGEIAYVDSQLTQVVKFAKNAEKAGKKILIVTVADHGEGLWEHGEPEHGIFLYQETIRIPLIFTWFPQDYQSQRIPQLVRIVDILPTVLDYSAMHIPNNIDGVSFRPLIEKKKKWTELYAYSETLLSREAYGWSELFSIQDHNWKFIHAPKPELYDLINDNKEKRNLSADTHSSILKELMHQLALLPYQIKMPTKKNMVTLSPEEQQKLASLGYAGQPRADKKTLPDPKDKLQSIKLMNKAETMQAEGHLQESIPILHEILKNNDKNRNALFSLIGAYELTNNFNEALNYSKKELQLGDKNGSMHFYIGLLYNKIGDIKNAELYYRKSTEINPYFPNPLFKLALLESGQGKVDLAEEHLLKMLDLKTQNADAYYLLGGIEAQKNDLQPAIEHFKKAAELNPLHLEALKNLGQAYYFQQKFKDAIDVYEKAIKLHPDDADLCLRIASIYFYDIKDNANALVYYKKTLEISPNHPKKSAILQRIFTLQKENK